MQLEKKLTRQKWSREASQVTFPACCAPDPRVSLLKHFSPVFSFPSILQHDEKGCSSTKLSHPDQCNISKSSTSAAAHILASFWSVLKESRIARRPADRRCPLTLLCHSCDRPLEDRKRKDGQQKDGQKDRPTSVLTEQALLKTSSCRIL